VSGTANRDDLKTQMVTLLDRTVPAVTVDEVRQKAGSLNAGGIARYRRSRRINTYAIGAATMATAICVFVVVLVFGFGVASTSRPTVVSPARPAFVPASWQKVTFGGLTMYAPGNWAVGSEQSWGDCGLTSQPFFKDNSVELDTGANAVVYHCLTANGGPIARNPNLYGLLVDPGPNGPLPDVSGFTKRLQLNGLWIDPATTSYGGILVLAVHIPGRTQPVAVEIGLAGAGKVAHTIEYSMRAAGPHPNVPPNPSSTSTTTSTSTTPLPPRTLSAQPLPVPPVMEGTVPVGTVVASRDISSRASSSKSVVFGLATIPGGSTYPAMSTDGGLLWKTAGPRFYYPAAQAASVVGGVIALPPDGATFWGQGGNFVRVTIDGGAHWWSTDFSDGVDNVTQDGNLLRALAFWSNSFPSGGGVGPAYLYVSSDSGQTWELRGIA
jgi:hypothetical protein